MVTDVQDWLDNPANNFGWLLKNQNETSGATAKRFASKQNGSSSNRPKLTIDFTAPPFVTASAISVTGDGGDGIFQIGDTIIFQFKLVFGSTTTIDGSGPTVSLPVTALAAGSAGPHGGIGVLVEDGAGTRFGSAYLATTTTAAVFPQEIVSTYLQAATVSATVPFTWGTLDTYAFTVTYEAA